MKSKEVNFSECQLNISIFNVFTKFIPKIRNSKNMSLLTLTFFYLQHFNVITLNVIIKLQLVLVLNFLLFLLHNKLKPGTESFLCFILIFNMILLKLAINDFLIVSRIRLRWTPYFQTNYWLVQCCILRLKQSETIKKRKLLSEFFYQRHTHILSLKLFDFFFKKIASQLDFNFQAKLMY